MKTTRRVLCPILSAAVSLLILAGNPVSAANFVTKTSQGSGNWTASIWSNPPNTTLVGISAGNTYEALSNGIAYGANTANTRLRNPVVAGQSTPHTFPGDSLTLNAHTDIRMKSNGPVRLTWLNFPGVGGNPGLILNGGALNPGDNDVFTITGKVQVSSASVMAMANNGLADFQTRRGIVMGGALTGNGAMLVLQGVTNIVCMDVTGTSNAFTGDWVVKAGYLRGVAQGSLGSGNIILDPLYAPSAAVVAAGTALSNGPILFEVSYDLNTTGALAIASGGFGARMILHQNIRVGSLTVSGTSVPLGTYSYATLTNMFPTNFVPGGSGSIAVGLPTPLITVLSPANNATFYNATGGINFTLTSQSTIDTNHITLILNGNNVSSGLVVSGSANNASVSYSGLVANTIYTASISASNPSGTSTTTFTFDTFQVGGGVVVEAEDYNYGDGECQPGTPTNPLESQFGGQYFNNPTPGQYLNLLGATNIDYFDTAAARGDTTTNAFRVCDFVGTKVTGDNARAPFIGSGFSDYDVWQIQPNEWLNYTRDFPATNYYVYLRVTSTAAVNFRLDRVNGDPATSGQTTLSLGAFAVTNTSGRYQLVQLKNALGSNAVVSLGSATTVRLTSLNAANNAQANFLLFVPVAASAPPVVTELSPAAGATGIYPDTAITASIADGDTAVNTATIVLRFNGVDVTSSATVTPNASGATVFYDPPGFITPGTTNIVSLEFQNDASFPASFTNTWSFTTISIPTVPATYATATGSASDSGFNIRIRKAPNSSPTATFPATILRAEQQLADLIIDPNTGLPYANEAAPGSTTALILNFEQTGTNNVGAFNGTNGYPDSTFPLIPFGDPRWTNDPNDIAIEATAYLELSAGVYRFAVRSDDGFRMTVGPTVGDTNFVLAQVDGGRGDAETTFDFLVLSNGVYGFRLLYFEAQGGASLEFYSVNRTNGVRTLINDSLTSGFIPAYRSRTGVPAAAPPQIVNVSPTNNSFFVTASSVSFEVLAGENSTIAPANVHLTLNGIDESGSLVVGGTSSDRTASFGGLQVNTVYTAVISVTDSALRTSTRTIRFDTFDPNQVVTVEAEDYNFADTSCPTTFTTGGAFLDPVPVDGYLNYAALPGIDYFDSTTNFGVNAYRPCDYVGVQISPDSGRPAYAGTNDYQVWRMGPGDWMNYTRLSWNGGYRVYARVASSAARQLTLSRVTSDASAFNQTTSLLGRFLVPNTGGVSGYQYVPLIDALGRPVTISLGAFETIRLNSVDANNDVMVNFLVLAPDFGASPPWIASASPPPGATKVQPSASINILVAHGDTAVNAATVALKVDGTDVTTNATITTDIYFTTIDYTPSTLWSTGATHLVQVVFQDNGAPVATVSNQWGFTTASGLIGFPIKVNFGATNSPVPAGYLEDVGELYGVRTNGYTYGWDRDLRADGRIRNNVNSPDLRFDTFMHMIKAVPPAVWEIVVPNGTYDVRIVGGDATAVDSVFQYDIEGTITPTYIPVSGAWWADFSVSTTVNDGKLTLRSGPASQTTANNNKVCFIDLVPPITPVAPTVTRNPIPLTVDAGQQAIFSVTYRATDPLTFQWYHDGAPVPGGTSATLLIPSAQVSDAGAYSVAITNVAGNTLSGSAQLTVNQTLVSNVVLRATLSGTNVLVSWTNTVNGGSLKQTDDLTPPVTWSPVTNAVFDANGNHNVLLPAAAAKKFFKLRP